MAVLGLDDQLAAARHRVAGVDGQVHHDLLQLSGIGLHAADLIRQAGDQFDVFSDQHAQHLHHVAHGLIGIEDLRFQNLLAAEGQQLASQSARSVAGALDLFQVRARLRSRGIEQHIAVALDDHDQIVEVMGHAAGETSDGFEPRRAQHAFARFLQAVAHFVEGASQVGDFVIAANRNLKFEVPLLQSLRAHHQLL